MKNLFKIAVNVLENRTTALNLEGSENSTSSEILNLISKHYNMSPSEYLELMRLNTSWGGGPEIVALSNFLERPIFVYELVNRRWFPRSFELKICAKFGFPSFHCDDSKILRILCADGRFVCFYVFLKINC